MTRQKPDIRSAAELTPERLKAWGGEWMLEDPDGCWYNATHHNGYLSSLRWGAMSNVFPAEYVRCYPIRNGEPWNFAEWDGMVYDADT
jgi:hypothetical protein